MLSKSIKFLSAVLMSLTVSLCAFAEDEVRVYVNSVRLNPDVAPRISAGRVLVPLRNVCEALGIGVSYENGIITVCDGQTAATLSINSNEMTVDDILGRNEIIYMDTAPLIVEGRTLIPARYIAETFGASVAWDSETKTASFTMPYAPIYSDEKSISLYAGILGASGHINGDMLIDSTFADIDDIAADSLGRLYVSEVDDIREIDADFAATINVESDFIFPKRICANASTLYFLSYPFADSAGNAYFAVFKNAYDSFFCVTPEVISCAEYGSPLDIETDNAGKIYVLCERALLRIDGEGSAPVKLADTPRELAALAAGDDGKIYLAGGGGGIYALDAADGQIKPFAGADAKAEPIDGKRPFFVNPTDIAVAGDKLYVADDRLLRIVTLSSDGAENSVSVALPDEAGENIRLCVFGDKAYMADTKNSVIWIME